MLAPRCGEPAPLPGASRQRPHRPADPHRGFKRVSPKSRQKAGCARAPHRAVPLRGHRADPLGRRGGGGAARAPPASPQGEKAFAIFKRLFLEFRTVEYDHAVNLSCPIEWRAFGGAILVRLSSNFDPTKPSNSTVRKSVGFRVSGFGFRVQSSRFRV